MKMEMSNRRLGVGLGLGLRQLAAAFRKASLLAVPPPRQAASPKAAASCRTCPRSRKLFLAVGLLLAAALLHPGSLPARTIVPTGASTSWKYLDNGSEPPANWREVEFDDSEWKSGKAPLGYGEEGLGTEVSWGSNAERKFIATRFRLSFDAPQLKPGEQLVLLHCVDDGAVFYLNGIELGRTNMPDGPLTAATLAARAIADPDEGFYERLPVPGEALRAGRNVIAVQVHQASPESSDLYFDVALKTLPAETPEPKLAGLVEEVVNAYNQRHYLDPEVRIPDGFFDGGRRMRLDADGRAASCREILLVDRVRDEEFARHLAFARSPELQSLPARERALRLAAHIDQETTPPGGLRWVEKTTGQLQQEFADNTLFLGDWIDQCKAGVCRHRSLLFKILADEAGLKTALVRGNFAAPGRPGFPHAWNELFLDDGSRVLVDVMHEGGTPKFRELTDLYVIERYRKVDDTPWYGQEKDQ
jgi:hypothetical protein